MATNINPVINIGVAQHIVKIVQYLVRLGNLSASTPIRARFLGGPS